MPELHAYSYAIIRLVPRVEREEFINVGVMVYSQMARFLEARFELNEARVRALWPNIDLEEVRNHLSAFCAIARGTPNAGPIAALPPTERFHWLAATRSTMLQSSAVHTGLCDDLPARLQHLLATSVTLA